MALFDRTLQINESQIKDPVVRELVRHVRYMQERLALRDRENEQLRQEIKAQEEK